jgi:DNA polymerase III sliding clamp (beta) subunit (PCNA family)
VIEEINAKQVIRVGREHFRRLIEKTHFAMAQQDVRYYLNGTMLETSGKTLRAVATDGHRLSLAETELAANARALGAAGYLAMTVPSTTRTAAPTGSVGCVSWVTAVSVPFSRCTLIS